MPTRPRIAKNPPTALNSMSSTATTTLMATADTAAMPTSHFTRSCAHPPTDENVTAVGGTLPLFAEMTPSGDADA